MASIGDYVTGGRNHWNRLTAAERAAILKKHPSLKKLSGGSFFSSLWKKVLKPMGKEIIKQGISKGTDALVKKVISGKGKPRATRLRVRGGCTGKIIL